MLLTTLQNNISQYIIYALIIAAIIAIIVSLIWTKLIRKNDFIYISKNIFIECKLRKIWKALLNKKQINCYIINAKFKNKPEIIGSIYNIVITQKKIYLLSNPISTKINSVKYLNKTYKVYNKKNQAYNLHLELKLFLENIKTFKKIYQTKAVIPIILVCDKTFKTCHLNNIYFINLNEIENFIIKNNLNQTELISQDLIKNIQNDIIFNEKVIFFFNKKYLYKNN